MAAILTNGVLKTRTAPIFQPLLAPARYKGSGSTKARDVPPPMPRIVRPGGRQHRLELATQRQTAKLTLSQLINRLLPQRAPVRHERLRRPAFRGRPRRHLTTSPPQLRYAAPVTAEITPAAGSCPALLSSRRFVAAHVRRPVSLGLVTLVTRLVTRNHFSRRNHPPLQLITQHHHISIARHRTPDPPNQRNDRSPVQHFQHSKKIAG